MSNGFDVLLKMIGDTNKIVNDLVKVTASNQTAIRIFGSIVTTVIIGGLATFFYKKIGG